MTTPGRESSEYLMAVVALALGIMLVLFGAWVLLFRGLWPGVAVMALGTAPLTLGPVAYAISRAKVKSPRPYLPPVGRV